MNIYSWLSIGILVAVYLCGLYVGFSPFASRLAAWGGLCAGSFIGGLFAGLLVRLVRELL